MENIPPPDDQDQQDDDSELMLALGQEVRKYLAEEMSILLARIDSRLDAQGEILAANSQPPEQYDRAKDAGSRRERKTDWYSHLVVVKSHRARMNELSERPGRLGHPTRQSRARPLESRHGGKL